MSTTTFPIYRGPAPEATRIRLLRGQVVIREEHDKISSILWTAGKRDGKEAHIGIVLAMGEPAYFDYSGRCVEVPWGFSVGDRVVFAWVSNPHHYTLPWIDGEPAAWVPQGAVLGVVNVGRWQFICVKCRPWTPRDEITMGRTDGPCDSCGETCGHADKPGVREAHWWW